MGPLRLVLFALSISISALPQYSFASDGNADIIHDTCMKVPFVDLCVRTLTTAVEVNKTDIHGLGAATACLQGAAQNGATTSAFISNNLDKAEVPAVQQCFNDCSKNYIDAVEQVEDSLVALDSGDYSDVELWVAAAVSDAQSCQDGCKGLNGEAPEELMRRNTEFSNLCSNVLAITNSLAS